MLLQGAAADKPNFVWILSEDNSKHYLRLFDEEMGAPAPNIEAMARDGLIYRHAFSNAPVCSVARTTLITSCYAPRIGTQFHRRAKMAPMPEGVKMFPTYLRGAGYYTTNRSKTDYNATPGRDVWDESSGKAHWRNRREGQSFFHKQSFPVSHESSLHFSEEEMRGEKTVTDPASVMLAPYHPDTSTFRYTYARYHDRTRDVDAIVGKMLDDLRNEGLLEDTFVFYFGDHGGVLPRSKGYAYESGLHVPLVVRIPENWAHLVNHARGDRVNGFVSFVDFGPTLLKLASLAVPDGVDGKAFLGEGIRAVDVEARDEAFGYADRFDEKADFVRTLRKGRYKYLRNFWPQTFDGLQNDYRYRMLAYEEWRELFTTGRLNEVQSQFFRPRPAEMLFDVEADPHEIRNLAEAPAHRTRLKAMRERLDAELRSWPDLSFYPESHLVAEAMDDPVSFGRRHREAIGDLIGLADLQWAEPDEAVSGLEAALGSEDRWQRYWAYLVATAQGTEASKFASLAERAAREDAEVEVRVRAAEFLGLTGLGDPRPGILAALEDSPSAVATNTILNTAVLLKDGEPGYEIEVPDGLVGQSDRYIEDRLAYLAGRPSPRARGK